ncbi:hypothetical protein BDV40DRAFT_76665 [Aspergillus tamarii]|uniref:Uncharacterized protein n=1 Tax=Aspergillus tamarii TaxID=41984 RepID=A0A5N6UD72_ASPTM|nr:hypothetical protein BDV40DRAFT_76665 [Aspergillus tamarii]
MVHGSTAYQSWGSFILARSVLSFVDSVPISGVTILTWIEHNLESRFAQICPIQIYTFTISIPRMIPYPTRLLLEDANLCWSIPL